MRLTLLVTTLSSLALAPVAVAQTIYVTTAADVVDFAGAQKVANLPGPDGKPVVFPHLFFDRHCPGAIVVDSSGRRFVSEGFHYQNFVNTMHRKGIAKAWLIADHAFQRAWGMGMSPPAPASAEALIRAGAFDSLDPHRARLLASVGIAIEAAEQAERNAMQASLFDLFEVSEQGIVTSVHAGGPSIRYMEGCA